MIKPLENKWMVVDQKDRAVLDTLTNSAESSIGLFLDDDDESFWLMWQSKGYRCVKVNIQFTEVK